MNQRLVEDCRRLDDGREFGWALGLTTFHRARFVSFGALQSVVVVTIAGAPNERHPIQPRGLQRQTDEQLHPDALTWPNH